MFSKPKPPQPVETVRSTPAGPRTPIGNPVTSNFSSRGASRASMGQRPNKLIRPFTGAMASDSSRPTLLGG